MKQEKQITPQEAVPSPQASGRVLVVDDSPFQRRIVSVMLRRWGYEVIEARSGDEAMKVCRRNPPDLVLSDWIMPGMDGLEFCQEFRSLPRENYGYFILLTCKSDKDEVARGLDNGADDFMTKPVSAPELRARIMAGERILRMQRELTEKNRLINNTLNELRALYASFDTDLIEARKLQHSLVRDRHRDFGRAEVSLTLRSSGHVGGDLVGVYPVSEDRIGLFAIDVSGHGISSALMTARLAGFLSASAPDQNIALKAGADGTYEPRPPADVVARLNALVLDEMETEHYFTLMLADVDLATGNVTFAQAGHPHPVIQRADGSIHQSGPGGLPVGLIENAKYQQFNIRLYPGDRLLILSDGVVECPDRDGQLLGEDGLEHLLGNLNPTRGTALLEALVRKLGDFAGSEDFPDDVSGILMEYKG